LSSLFAGNVNPTIISRRERHAIQRLDALSRLIQDFLDFLGGKKTVAMPGICATIRLVPFGQVARYVPGLERLRKGKQIEGRKI
jgi:hypothetical protein